MCGIVGCISKLRSGYDLEEVVGKMNDSIHHRGPSEDGLAVVETDSCSVGLAMKRLSIIDLESGSQPFTSDDGMIYLTYNGEIYNYKKLRNELIGLGDTFHTESDTEVVLRMYERYGSEAFRELDGMFAIAILDRNLDRMYFARDYFGEKPLFYGAINDCFYWSSELKGIKSVVENTDLTISYESVSAYFQYFYIPAPHTIFNEIKKLNANTVLEYNLSTGSRSFQKIYDDNSARSEVFRGSYGDAVKINRDLIFETVESRAISDVPLGSFLSGGVDSSIVTYVLAELNSDVSIDTFSIGFENKKFDESAKAERVAKRVNSNHHKIMFKSSDLLDILDEVILNYDEPYADMSSLATYLVSKAASTHVKVALTGDGGDELYGGYNKYRIGAIHGRLSGLSNSRVGNSALEFVKNFTKTKTDSRGFRFKLRKVIDALQSDENFYLNMLSMGFKSNELPFLLNTSILSNSIHKNLEREFYKQRYTLKDFRHIDKQLSLESDLLVKVDRASMLASIEARAPFLNKTLWDFTMTLPDNFLMSGNNKKRILKDSFRKDFDPRFLDSKKQGFGVPVGDWLRVELRNELLDYIKDEFLTKQGIFNIEYAQSIVKSHIFGGVDNTFRVWTFYCFQKWYVNNITMD